MSSVETLLFQQEDCWKFYQVVNELFSLLLIRMYKMEGEENKEREVDGRLMVQKFSNIILILSVLFDLLPLPFDSGTLICVGSPSHGIFCILWSPTLLMCAGDVGLLVT